MVKIISVVRTRNEEEKIALYCRQHDFADLILVGDGGSEDKTIEIAEQFPNVKVRAFTETVELEGGHTRNPDWKHINFLIEWAEEEGADWIQFEDCDTNPNYLLRKDARKIMEQAEHAVIKAVQMFLWENNQYFPDMARPNNARYWQAGVWAWKSELKLRTWGEMPHFHFKSLVYGEEDVMYDFSKEACVDIFPPYCRLHTCWEDPVATKAHAKMYRDSGLITEAYFPTPFAGIPVERDDWIRYEE
jgi:glycosyltransferase involved in cell wall biosynthesis